MSKGLIEGFRLSPQQRRLWLLQQNAAVHRAQLFLMLEGLVDVSLLRAAFVDLVDRHAILRTTFQLCEGVKTPLQVIEPQIEPSWRVIDLRRWSQERQGTFIEKLWRREARREFDFERGPLVYAVLLRLEETRSLLSLSLPSLCADDRSLMNLTAEISAGYGFQSEGLGAFDEPAQYLQFSEWRNELLENEGAGPSRAYWDLSTPPNLRLSFERSAGPETPFDPQVCPLEIGAEVAGEAKELVERYRVSLPAALLAAWQALLWRCAVQKDVLVANAFDGREYEELKNTVGPLTSYLPVEARIVQGMRFCDLIKAVDTALREAAEWQDYFPHRDAAAATNTAFCFIHEEEALPLTAGGVRFNVHRRYVCDERYKVKLRCVESVRSLQMELHYDAARFSATEVERLGECYAALLKGLHEEAERRIDELNLLDPAERRRALVDWNGAEMKRVDARPIHELFEIQVEKTPDAAAVVFEEECLSYRALNSSANELAHRLRDIGVGPETPVGLFVERGLGAIVGMLGILKAGGFFVPLDVSSPPARVAFLVKDSGMKALVSQESLIGKLSPSDVPILCQPIPCIEEIALGKDDNPAPACTPENLAYVIYTSGSTGNPKGVAIEHRSLCNYLRGLIHRLDFREGESFALVSTFAADLGHTAIFPPLCLGGCLHVISQERASDATLLADYFARRPIDNLKIVPSHMAALQAGAGSRSILPRKRLILGGEALRWDWAQKLGSPECRKINHYGPTETTVGVLTYELERPSGGVDHRVSHGLTAPVGRPLANSQAYILDDHGSLSHSLIPGELSIGGLGVARGYLNRPELTAEKFVPDPYGESFGGRLYRTGDLVRRLPNGEIVFLGRRDHQVKVRGYRVEPGEIQSALTQHPAVREAVVIAREETSGQPVILAYVVPAYSQAVEPKNPRLHRLPNDLDIFHLNRNETEHLYREIFEDRLYLKHGVAIDDNDCIFDVGANIGVFTLFAHLQGKDVKVYAFEPNPFAFEKLSLNVARYGLNAHLFDYGLAEKERTAAYTFYPQASVMSGFYPNVKEEQRLFKSFMLSQQKGHGVGVEALTELADELSASRFEGEELPRQLRTVSSVIREHGIERIDLLKIDVEKSEMDVLLGVDEEDWPRIKQIVIEVHQIGGRVEKVVELLQSRGFDVVRDILMEETGVFNLFARRPGLNSHRNGGRTVEIDDGPRVAPKAGALSSDELREFLRSRLPEYMRPSQIVILNSLPLTPNGKVDYQALPAPETFQSEADAGYSAPRTQCEEVLAGLWADLLGRERVGRKDNFFDIGGHSLLATQLISRVRETFQVELALRALFEEPSVAGLARRIEKSKQGEMRTLLPPITRRRGDPQLSFAQQRLWFLHQFDPDSPAYNIPRAIRLTGTLNLEALRKALNEVATRHEVLRTTFAIVDGMPALVVSADWESPLPVIDLQGNLRREEEARNLAAAEAAGPFDLARGPLFRASLIRLSDEEHIALLTMHHIVSDGWSTAVLDRELGALYEAFSQGLPSPLAELPVQYADYAAWQRECLTGSALAEPLDYWKRRLADAPPPLALPTDRPRRTSLSGRGGEHRLTISEELTRSLQSLGRRSGATLFMTLLAAFKTLLSRYTGQTDIVIGAPVAGRSRPETEELIGFFVNTLVLRTDLSGDPTFMDLLQRVRAATIDALAHQDTPFEMLVEQLQPERAAGRTPFFQMMFAVQDAPPPTANFPGLSLDGLEIENTFSKFDLAVDAVKSGNQLLIYLQYSADLFDAATIEHLADHFHSLLKAVAAAPDQRLSTFDLFTEQQRDLLLRQWNHTRRDYPLEKCIPQLVEEQTERTPEFTAVVFENRRLSYRELNIQANRIARALLQRGLGRGAYVPVLMDRSLSLTPTLLGVMKTGAAFVPLDIEWPTARLRRALDDLSCEAVLVNTTTPQSSEELGRRFLNVEALLAEGPSDNLQIQIASDDPIYVIYTSGSTGVPKGVVIPHRGIANRFRWMTEFFGAEAAKAALQTTRHVFDSAVWQLFWPLINGGRTVLPAAQMDLTANAFTNLIDAEEITIADFVPSVFNMIAPQLIGDSGLRARLRTLRSLIIGGEEITPTTTYRFIESFPTVRVFNLYGPTEASIGCICYEVNPTEPAEQRNSKIPIGKPIANAHALALDQSRRLAPIGAAGELYLSGACLGLGYINDHEKTQTAFIDNPFPEIGYPKLYRTGDQVRYLSNGDIEFLGRVDQQVKVRGYRIEVGEVEATLREHPSIREAAVIVVEGAAGGKKLAAYVVTLPERLLSDGNLRDYLKERLPGYMVPSVIATLDRLPLTLNGKIDRAALSALADSQSDSQTPLTPPRSPIEEALMEVWASVLKRKNFGVHDNFFELGGHSLLATQIISRVQELFPIEISLRTLFEGPTIGELAQQVEFAIRADRSAASSLLERVVRDGKQPLSFAQQRLWFLDRLEPGGARYNLPAAFRIKGRLDLGALERSLNQIIERHESLRTVFKIVEQRPVQVILSPQPLSLGVKDLSDLPVDERESETKRLAEEEGRRPFDLECGPLLRISILRLGNEEHALLLTVHHIVFDGWSAGVFIRELGLLYEAFLEGKPSPLAEPSIQYVDYALWQRSYLQGERLDTLLAYWRGQLSGAPPLLRLRTERPRPARQGSRGARRFINFPYELSEQLKDVGRREGATLYMTLLTAFKGLLSRYSNQSDIVVGTPVAGRKMVEAEALIGFFVNTLVIRTNLGGDPSFLEALRRVRAAALEAFAHQDLPFEKLVEELRPERNPGFAPIFRVSFALQNLTTRELTLQKLTVESMELDVAASKFDLSLFMAETEQGLVAAFTYDADLFEPKMVEQMADDYRRILEVVAAHPERTLKETPLTLDADVNALIEEFNTDFDDL